MNVDDRQIAVGGVLGGVAARWAWLMVWLGTAALGLEPAARVPAAQLSDSGEDEPAAIAVVGEGQEADSSPATPPTRAPALHCCCSP
ncbi:hypothetical protein [Streptomyces sp. NPDC001137]|uniref:hypothetical protein n=1 Tax=Streptomyces sp. NPDC001137 TaxID=3154378 RepID=UPI003316CFED